MKVIKNAFLFFYLIFSIPFNTNGFKLHGQALNDSLNYYYEFSKDAVKDNDEKLNAINRLIYLAHQNDKIEFLLKGLNRKSFLYYKIGDYNKAISVANTLLEESNKVNDSSKIVLAYRRLADYSRLNDSLLNAYKFYQKHKDLNLKLKDSLGVIRDLRFMTSIQYKLGLLYESESLAVEAIAILDKLPVDTRTTEARIGLSNHLGIIYNQLGKYNGALALYNKLLETATDIHHLNIIHNNKANVYREQKKYKLAAIEFETVYKNSLKINDEQHIARALNNLAFVKSKFDAPNALDDLMTALNIRKRHHDNKDLFSSYTSLAEYYKDRGVKKKMMHFAKKAYNVTLKTKNYLDRIIALSFLIEAGEIHDIIEYKKLTDSIAKAKQSNENKFAYIKYNYIKKEQEARNIELKFKDSQLMAEKEKVKKTVFQFVGLGILLISIFLYFLVRSRHKKEKLLQVYNTETRISKKVHDEVANDIYHVMTKLQGNHKKETEVLDDLEHIYSKTRDISKESSIIDLNEEFESLLYDLLQTYHSKDTSVITKGLKDINWKDIHDLNKTAIYRVLQELMTNMKKHSKASIVVLKFEKVKDKISIQYNDNGVGCEIKKHNGLQNTENRIVSHNGTITFESQINKGFKAKITI
ncbi:ATP-binding protein [Algibacter sp. AS12]|uniref:tetratricopeptide repeat-containing sensor histidine kinase n=1 Tax=Algibacter sp. AS12 TaxID=3135773 RepID=UPI00398A5508